MTEQQPLANLHDIHLPEPVSWWPPALGWDLLFLLLILMVCIGGLQLYYYYMNSRPKRQALKLLYSYQQDYLKTGNAQITSARISELLRRVALVYFPRETVASLRDDAWLEFLNHTAKKVNFNAVRNYLLELPYQPNNKNVNLKPLFVRAQSWIKQRGKLCSN